MSYIVNGANQALLQRGFVESKPNQKHTYGPLALTSMHWEEWIRTRPFPDERMFRIDSATLYAVLSGAADGSNLGRNIQYSISKNG
jgi:hypothetical protein